MLREVDAMSRSPEARLRLIEAAKDAVREWRLHGQLTESCRHLEAAIKATEEEAATRPTQKETEDDLSRVDGE